MRILVAGGGISGLATAVALGRRGHHVLVLEQRPVFTESGVGVRLVPRAFQLLDQLGVGDAVRERSLAIDEFHVMDGSTGERVTSATLPTCRGRSYSAHATAHRLDVYEPLLEACWDLDSVQLCTDSRAVGYTQHGESVVVALANGRTVTGDALILADGVRSLAHNDAEWAGVIPEAEIAVYHTVIPMESQAGPWGEAAATSWVGTGWHLSHYPLPDYQYLSISATRHRHTGAGLFGARLDLEHVLAAFPEIGYAARNVLTMGEYWRAWTVRRQQETPRWASGRIALVGDTAHPARLLEDSGVHHALEDAVALGESDSPGAGVRSWLADYHARRGEQVRQVHAEAGPGQPEGPRVPQAASDC
ncbi:FAD-dependent monooxygenase [Streptomyces sp. NPDC093544]|jgi:2-polyprenyl-6-methoxyphenol hydroxylase-like FAD-dependent oxidoreductase|uniref:FAD-dependent monooxygenase n=1 Tax=Streptomyces sp. NPDC093544 TaxID=3155200 RepID=UPI00341AEE0A